ncbi:MAG: hypothetical protein COB98_10770 [Flavobacteriaceae bacterium]|nr:MAG: hypothetical protein COB98_10770 [Flavobacteriaceae bacterium]
MNSSYKILPSEKLVLKKIRGDVTLNDMKIIFNEIRELTDRYLDFNNINDYRETQFLFEKNDFLDLIKSVSPTIFPTTKTIFILDKPTPFVLYHFFKDKYSFKNTQVFNTIEGACASNAINPILIKDFFETLS